jgi:hypothetical protein
MKGQSGVVVSLRNEGVGVRWWDAHKLYFILVANRVLCNMSIARRCLAILRDVM